MSSYVPTNIFGESGYVSNNDLLEIKYVVHNIEGTYVNESGDKIYGQIDMSNNRIINVLRSY